MKNITKLTKEILTNIYPEPKNVSEFYHPTSLTILKKFIQTGKLYNHNYLPGKGFAVYANNSPSLSFAADQISTISAMEEIIPPGLQIHKKMNIYEHFPEDMNVFLQKSEGDEIIWNTLKLMTFSNEQIQETITSFQETNGVYIGIKPEIIMDGSKELQYIKKQYLTIEDIESIIPEMSEDFKQIESYF